MNDSDTKFVLQESLEIELDSDDEPLNVLIPEANYYVVENATIKKTLEEGSSKAEKEVNWKSKEKGKGERKEREIKNVEIDFDWGKKHAPYAKEQCSLKADIIHQFPEYQIPFDVFSAVTNLDGFVKLLVHESNLYAQQIGREFHTNKQEIGHF